MSDDTQNLEAEQEEQISDDSDETTEDESTDESEEVTEESVESLKKQLANKEAQLKRLTKDKVTNKQSKSSNSDIEQLRQQNERLELKIDGYSQEMIDAIMEAGGKSALSNPIIKSGIEAMVAQERTEKASSADGVSQSRTKSNVSLEELKTMSSAEMAKHLPKAE